MVLNVPLQEHSRIRVPLISLKCFSSFYFIFSNIDSGFPHGFLIIYEVILSVERFLYELKKGLDSLDSSIRHRMNYFVHFQNEGRVITILHVAVACILRISSFRLSPDPLSSYSLFL